MEESSILLVADLFSKAARDIILRFCSVEVTVAKTAQFIPTVQISGDLGSFVSFDGDYSGLMVLNFSGTTALELVVASLKAMGMPDDDIPHHHQADDVVNSLGELTNHIIGRARTNVQNQYDLIAHATIPAVVPVNKPIGLVFKSTSAEETPCIRISFRTPKNNHFHMELALEQTRFASLSG